VTIDSITIRNFQSLTDVNLSLSGLTVIVGASSSGKSAFIRSMRALAGNRRGTDFITHGERTASISVHQHGTDPARAGTITLTRSTQTAPNSYTLIPDDPNHPLAPKAEFTKLGGDVPPEVSQFLGIPTDQLALVIASQFDKPYLLDAPGTEVARVLASLTNAHIILNGARESNRLKLTASQTLKTRSHDLEAIQARIPEFRALQAQRTALDSALALIDSAQKIQARVTRLAQLADTVAIAEQRIPALTQQLASIPDPISIDAAAQRLADARSRLSTYMRAIQAVSDAQRVVREREAQLSVAAEEHNSAIDAARAGMQDIAQGFRAHFVEHSTTMDAGKLEVDEAARLSAQYMATLDS